MVTLLNGLRVGGFNGSWRYKPRGNFLYGQGEAAILLQQLPPVDILVAHNSPQGVHERDADTHQGFMALSDCVRRHMPRLLVHGHQHANRETMVGVTRVALTPAGWAVLLFCGGLGAVVRDLRFPSRWTNVVFTAVLLAAVALLTAGLFLPITSMVDGLGGG